MLHFAAPPILFDFSLLLIRVLVAITFLVAARNKFRDIRGFAKHNGVPVPVARFIMTAELLGGLGMASGVLGQWAAIGLMLLMLGSIRFHVFVWKSPYWAAKGGWEYDSMLFALCSVVAINGPGSLALL